MRVNFHKITYRARQKSNVGPGWLALCEALLGEKSGTVDKQPHGPNGDIRGLGGVPSAWRRESRARVLLSMKIKGFRFFSKCSVHPTHQKTNSKGKTTIYIAPWGWGVSLTHIPIGLQPFRSGPARFSGGLHSSSVVPCAWMYLKIAPIRRKIWKLRSNLS